MEHVLDQGFGRIAFLGYRSATSWDTERAAGSGTGLAARGISPDQSDMLFADEGNARRKVRSLLSARAATGARTPS